LVVTFALAFAGPEFGLVAADRRHITAGDWSQDARWGHPAGDNVRDNLRKVDRQPRGWAVAAGVLFGNDVTDPRALWAHLPAERQRQLVAKCNIWRVEPAADGFVCRACNPLEGWTEEMPSGALVSLPPGDYPKSDAHYQRFLTEGVGGQLPTGAAGRREAVRRVGKMLADLVALLGPHGSVSATGDVGLVWRGPFGILRHALVEIGVA